MRFESRAFVVLFVAFTITVEASAQQGAYSLGDCLVPEGVFSCRIYLTAISGNSINYLDEVSCPGCIQGEPIGIGPDGKTKYADPTCQEDKTWSNPSDVNLDLALTHYDPAEGIEPGADVTGFDQLKCWSGGNCLTGECEKHETGLTDVNTGIPLMGWKCRKDGNDIFYVVKKFGNTCVGPNGYGNGGADGSGDGGGDGEGGDAYGGGDGSGHGY